MDLLFMIVIFKISSLCDSLSLTGEDCVLVNNVYKS